MRYCFFILVFALSYMAPLAATGQHYKVTIKIAGLKNSQGKVMLSLYNHDDGYPQYPEKALRNVSQAITGNTCTIVLTDIPPGTYAIACYHDENNNGKLEKNFIGIPTEGTGASNNAKGFMGPPKFKDAAFTVDKDMEVSVQVDYR